MKQIMPIDINVIKMSQINRYQKEEFISSFDKN